ncbi:MAG: hypothetical protein RJA13_1557 [Bacteroidota bacterium]
MKQLLHLLFVGLLASSCIKNNPDPAWLEVTKWSLVANPNSENQTGELTHNFSEAWVYIDDKIVGVFEVPFKIPILQSGNVNIKIYPAIKNNGIAATKKIYPFVEVFEVNANLVQNQTLTLNPITRYVSVTKFWIEDFEDPAVKIITDPNSQTALSQGSDPLILEYGNNYGEVNLNLTDSTWVAFTEQLPYIQIGKEVYLEIDYYNTNALITGLIAISPSSVINNQNVQLNPQDPASVKWKKIYIDLKEVVSNSSAQADFRISFQALIDSGDSEGKIVLDNIKVVSF